MAKLTRNRWEASTQYSVDSILGAKIREVKVKGSEFYNVDRWTARTLWAQIVESIKVYGNALDEWTVRDAVRTANCTNVNDPHLVVASSPDRVPPWLMRASVGGAYHEAWHTEWSCRRDLSFTEADGADVASGRLGSLHRGGASLVQHHRRHPHRTARVPQVPRFAREDA